MRYNIEIGRNGRKVAEGLTSLVEGAEIVSTVSEYNDAGHDLAIIDVPGDLEFFEMSLESDENVISYRSN